MKKTQAKSEVRGVGYLTSGRFTPHGPSPQPKLVAKKPRYITPTPFSPKSYKFKRVKNEGRLYIIC